MLYDLQSGFAGYTNKTVESVRSALKGKNCKLTNLI